MQMAGINIIKNDRQLIVGIGSALVDILIHEDDKFIEKTDAVKGGMTLVDSSWIERTLAAGSSASANWAARLALSASVEPTSGAGSIKMTSNNKM